MQKLLVSDMNGRKIANNSIKEEDGFDDDPEFVSSEYKKPLY